MRSICLITILCAAVSSNAAAQTFDLGSSQLYEPLIGAPAITGARAAALGGAVTGSVQDGSALWSNPAALARIPRIEISGDLVHNRVSGETLPLSLDALATVPSVSATGADLRRTRFGSAYVTLPVPTYRGALTLAGGVTVSQNLDRVLFAKLDYAPGSYVEVLDSTQTTYVAEEIDSLRSSDDQRGSVHAWQLGFGVDISPRVSLGFAGVYYKGSMDFTNKTHFNAIRSEGAGSPDTAFPVVWDIVTANRESISGWGAHGGILFRPRNDLALGAVVRTPVKFTIDLDQVSSEQRDLGSLQEFESFTTRRLQLPFSMAAGGAWLYRRLLVAVDLGYTDWSQAEYKDSPALTQYNDELSKSYRESVSIGGGVEWIIPNASTTLRAGARWAQLPFQSSLIADERVTLSLGAGFLIDQTMAIDLALAHETWRGGNPIFGFDERYATTRILATAAYRI